MNNSALLSRDGYDDFFERPARPGTGRRGKKRLTGSAAPSDFFPNFSLSMKEIAPKTRNQEKLIQNYREGKHIVALGCAGTGKSFVGMYLALKDVLQSAHTKKQKLIIVRSGVQARDQGFLPGSLAEKMKVYEAPYESITKTLFGRADAYEILKRKEMISFESTSFLRGETFDNAVVLFDEVQNCNHGELLSLITRMGENSRLIMCGDHGQNDLTKTKYDQSGLREFMKILNRMSEISVTNFAIEDIVRSGFVRSFYTAMYQEEMDNVEDDPCFHPSSIVALG